MAKLVSKVYGDALFEAALEKGKVEQLYEEAKALLKILENNPELLTLLGSPRIVREEKADMIREIFGGRVCEELEAFLTIIVGKNRQKELSAVLAHFIRRVKEYKKIGEATVTSAVPLKEKQKAELEKKLLASTEYVELEMDYQVDASILGGLVIRIGDRVVDSSIKTRLYELKKELSALQLA